MREERPEREDYSKDRDSGPTNEQSGNDRRWFGTDRRGYGLDTPPATRASESHSAAGSSMRFFMRSRPAIHFSAVIPEGSGTAWQPPQRWVTSSGIGAPST